MPTQTITTNPAPFIIQPHLTAIAIAYRNERMIADQVLPRVPVPGETFKYSLYDKTDQMTIPDTKVGRTSRPNEVDWHATETSASVRPYGLEEPIPQSDIDNAAGSPVDPQAIATEQLTNLVDLDREQRAANLVFAAASYAMANKTTLVQGTSQWSDTTAGVSTTNPLAQIQDAMDGMLMRPNQLVLGRRTATLLRRNSFVVKAFHGNLGDTGMVPLAFLQDYLELSSIVVGEAWVNTAKKGQTASISRLWGPHAALLYTEAVSANVRSMTFGVTAQFKTRIAGSRPDPDIGLKGGIRVRVGEEVTELVLANDLGYFFQNAVTP